jgi:hypothetical protein
VTVNPIKTCGQAASFVPPILSIRAAISHLQFTSLDWRSQRRRLIYLYHSPHPETMPQVASAWSRYTYISIYKPILLYAADNPPWKTLGGNEKRRQTARRQRATVDGFSWIILFDGIYIQESIDQSAALGISHSQGENSILRFNCRKCFELPTFTIQIGA